MTKRLLTLTLPAVLAAAFLGCMGDASPDGAAAIELLNASYDPTRELWRELNEAFIPAYRQQTGLDVTVTQSHAASGSQARAIVDGLPADVATLSLWQDTEQLHKAGLLKDGWEESLPNRSLPYTSTVVFLVRAGNPKGIKDWADLAKPDVAVVTPNPKTSGNGRLSFLGAWGSVVLNGGTEDDARKLVGDLYRNVEVLDTGARGSTSTFAMKGIGDVLITMESEAYLSLKESPGQFEIVNPSISILHEPHIAVVDSIVDRNGTRAHAEAYLKFLYTQEGQEIIAKNFFRPSDEQVAAKHRDQFPTIRLFSITEIAKDWNDAQTRFFGDGGVFDGIYQPSGA
jgi:sulfate transport system substrate-binding protein